MPMRKMLSGLAMFWGLLFVAAAGLAAWQLRSIGRRATPTVDQIARTMADVMNRVEYQLAVSYLRQAENENCVMCTNGDSCILPIRNQGVRQNRTGSENAIKHLTASYCERPIMFPRGGF